MRLFPSSRLRTRAAEDDGSARTDTELKSDLPVHTAFEAWLTLYRHMKAGQILAQTTCEVQLHIADVKLGRLALAPQGKSAFCDEAFVCTLSRRHSASVNLTQHMSYLRVKGKAEHHKNATGSAASSQALHSTFVK